MQSNNKSDALVYEEYSNNNEYKFQVYEKQYYFETKVLKKESYDTEYLPDDRVYYFECDYYKHISDTLEKAVEIGRECIRNLTG